MRTIIVICFIVSVVSCKDDNFDRKDNHVQVITDVSKQEALFQQLTDLVRGRSSDLSLNDSVSFLVLPVQKSCPSCRKKTIDSIVKYQDKLDKKRFIIISANGGRKTVNAYFREQQHELPAGKTIILDSIDAALQKQLYTSNTAFYYAFNRKIYKKVAALPITIKGDLSEFFNK